MPKRAYFGGPAPIPPGMTITVRKGKEHPDFIIISDMVAGDITFLGPTFVPSPQMPTMKVGEMKDIINERYRVLSVTVDSHHPDEAITTVLEVEREE